MGAKKDTSQPTPASKYYIGRPSRGSFPLALIALYFLYSLLQLCKADMAFADGKFPIYKKIQQNIRFWELVYSHYSTQQGILHDQEDLSIIYTVVNLVDWEKTGASRINRRRIKQARQHYKDMLAKLASGKRPVTEDEKRVAAMFASGAHYSYRRARDKIRLQIGQKDRFLQGVIRSGAYLPAIKKIFTSYGLPQELSYLPHVESSFNPEAHSKVGATGLWQFTRSTGRKYMRVDHVVDQRYDPYYSSRAAAIFLKENYDALGSWPLAITAYNHGRNGMLRAVKKYGSYEEIFANHQTRMFGFASRNFYSEFIAALNVARRLEQDRSILPNRQEASILVRMEGFVRVDDILNHFRLSEEDFTRLNPALQKPVLEGKKYIPKDYYLRFPATDVIRDLATVIPSHIYQPRQIRDREYIVQRGDTAGGIARRYKISLAELIKANNLNKNAMIRIGQQLKIPSNSVEKNDNIVTLQSNSKNKPN